MTEAAIVEAGRRVIHRRGGWTIKTHGGGVGRNGIPDVIGAYRGRAFGIEFKTPSGRVDPLQRFELRQMGKAGAATLIARSAADVEALLDGIDAELDGVAA